jgi:hypothetical protein
MKARKPLRAKELIKDYVDIHEYPDVKDELIPDQDCELTMGDLHGNAIKLLHFLIRQNLLNIEDSTYQHLVEIYQKDATELNESDLRFFEEAIAHAVVLHPAKIRLIGDELADRGNNDYFTLFILSTLAKKKLAFELVYSNHTSVFFNAFKQGLDNLTPSLFRNRGIMYRTELNAKGLNDTRKQDLSLQNLGRLIDRKLVSSEKIASMVDEVYTDRLKLVSYSRDEKNKTIFIYTHAPVGLESIKELSDKWLGEGEYSDQHCLQVIDKLNEKFTEKLKNKETEYDQLNDDIMRFLWNRVYDESNQPHYETLSQPQELNGYKLVFVHGHDGSACPKKIHGNVINLDNDHGKGRDANIGEFVILHTQSSHRLEEKANLQNTEPAQGHTHLFDHRGLEEEQKNIANKGTAQHPDKHH